MSVTELHNFMWLELKQLLAFFFKINNVDSMLLGNPSNPV